MVKGISGKKLLKKHFKTWDFVGKWEDSFGKPAKNAKWLIWGDSGNGKTDFAVQLAKYFTGFGRVAYISSEEGVSRSLQLTFARNTMHECGDRISIFPKMELPDLQFLLTNKRYKIIFIDSLDDMNMGKAIIQYLKDHTGDKTIVLLTWAEGKWPKTEAGKAARYLAGVKIRVNHYIAEPVSRMGGANIPFVIWEDGAKKYHPFLNRNQINDNI